jgi:hypothetical protein
MSEEKFDRIGYEFTLASGDNDWSDCNFFGEKNGKKTWLGTLASEKRIHGSDEYWDYDDIEDFARKACASQDLYDALINCHDLLRDAMEQIPRLSGFLRMFQSQLDEVRKAILKARGK